MENQNKKPISNGEAWYNDLQEYRQNIIDQFTELARYIERKLIGLPKAVKDNAGKWPEWPPVAKSEAKALEVWRAEHLPALEAWLKRNDELIGDPVLSPLTKEWLKRAREAGEGVKNTGRFSCEKPNSCARPSQVYKEASYDSNGRLQYTSGIRPEGRNAPIQAANADKGFFKTLKEVAEELGKAYQEKHAKDLATLIGKVLHELMLGSGYCIIQPYSQNVNGISKYQFDSFVTWPRKHTITSLAGVELVVKAYLQSTSRPMLIAMGTHFTYPVASELNYPIFK